jgi:hypothetical protein
LTRRRGGNVKAKLEPDASGIIFMLLNIDKSYGAMQVFIQRPYTGIMEAFDKAVYHAKMAKSRCSVVPLFVFAASDDCGRFGHFTGVVLLLYSMAMSGYTLRIPLYNF